MIARPGRGNGPVRRALFALSALIVAGCAYAEWFQLGRSEAMRFYLDDKLIARNGDFVRVVQLMDFTTAQWVDARTVVGSVKLVLEYDCKLPRSRALSSEAFSEQMAEGALVSREQAPDPQWEAIEKGTTPDRIRELACGGK